jgi:hypothetical protein
MKHLLLVFVHQLGALVALAKPGGTLVAENLLLRHELLILRRSRQPAPNLRTSDRVLFGLGSLFLSPCSSGTKWIWNRSWSNSRATTQPVPHAPITGRSHTGGKRRRFHGGGCQFRTLWLAKLLPRLVSATDRRLNTNSPPTGENSGDAEFRRGPAKGGGHSVGGDATSRASHG